MSSKSKSSPSKGSATQQSALFILQYKSRRVLVASPKDYKQLQASIRRHFPEIPVDHRVLYHTDELTISKGAPVEVSEDIWETAIPLLNTLKVGSEPQPFASKISGRMSVSEKKRECDSSCDEKVDHPKPLAKKYRRDAGPSMPPSRALSPPPRKSRGITLKIATLEGRSFSYRFDTLTSVSVILSTAIEKLKLDKAQTYRACHEGRSIGSSDSYDWDHLAIQKWGLKDGDEILLVPRLIGGKPVIYLLPPSGAEVDASVTLSLVPEWHFSAVYPVVPITSCVFTDRQKAGGQTIQWNVKASSDGSLLEKNTGLDVAYLFWEAETFALPAEQLSSSSSTLAAPPSRFDGDSKSIEAVFIPTHPRIDPLNSVVLEVAKLTPYLDSMLKALGLHVEARTSFITYWLPSFLKHTHIALRFLPQHAYERAAPLNVEPKPDVTVRVFMLFKGLKQDQVQNEGSGWCAGTEGDVKRWKGVVGVDESQSLADRTLFRVVEWGGMEVLS